MIVAVHIFISYAKKDTKKLASKVRDTLATLPTITAWMDESLETGGSWARQIEREIKRCDLFIVLISEDVSREQTETQDSSFVLNEIHYAKYQFRKPILPVLVQKTQIPVEIVDMQYIDFTRNQATGIEKLIEEVCKRAGIEIPDHRTVAEQQPVKRWKAIAGALIFLLTVVGTVFFSGILNGNDNNENRRQEDVTEVVNAATQTQPPPPDTPSATPTDAPTLSERDRTIQLAFTGVDSNAEWTPYSEMINGVEMVLVPTGCFMMGSEDGRGDEKPVHEQCFDKPFWIDRTEVTRTMYQECVEAGACEETPANEYSTSNEQPVNRVSWIKAQNYCEWRQARLPSEKEWEYAARGVENLIFPWGNDFVAENVVYKDNSNNVTSGAGSRRMGASWVGALDMSGNVWEWTNTRYRDYPYSLDDGRENYDIYSEHVLRGGAFLNDDRDLRTSVRDKEDSFTDGYFAGFRCARDFE